MKMKLLVPVALIAIGAGLYGLSENYFSQQKGTPLVTLESSVESEPMAPIYALTRAVERGSMVSKADLEVRQVPEREVLKLGIDVAQPLTLTPGSVVIQDLAAGELLTPARVITPQEPGYIEAIVADNKVPYAIEVSSSNMVGGLITHGSLVDVVALSSEQQNLANDERVTGYKTVSIAPVLLAVKVLRVDLNDQEDERTDPFVHQSTTLILELSQRQVAKLAIAKNISQLEVHKSLGRLEANDLQANSGDVLPDYRAIVEFRGEDITIK